MILKKYISNVQKYAAVDQLFEALITQPLENKNKNDTLHFYKFQREISQLNKQIDNDDFNYDQNFMSDLKIQRINYLNQHMKLLNPAEFNYLLMEIIQNIKKNSPKDKTKLNTNIQNFQKLEETPIPYLDSNYQKRQQIVTALTPIGPEGFSAVLQAFGGVAEVQQQEEVQQEEQIEEKVVKKEEKTNFDVELTSFDAGSKIKIIKDIRSVLNLGLKEAKDMVEKAPVVISKDTPKEKAEELAEKFKALGCVITLL